MSKVVHQKVVDAARKSLAGMSRNELRNRRTLLEVVIREAEKQNIPWREIPAGDDKLTVGEQYDLIDEALLALNPDTGVVVGVKTGHAILKTFKQEGD
jgi:hypothetical protein